MTSVVGTHILTESKGLTCPYKLLMCEIANIGL